MQAMAMAPILGAACSSQFTRNHLIFALNGQKVELAMPDPSMTLLTYLRSQTPLRGAKLGCGDGGCGACLVLLSKYDPATGSVEHHSINACIALLCSIDGCSITTIEGLRRNNKQLHAVQERIAGFHGSQCGFCTPGMCISMLSCFLNVSGSPRKEEEEEEFHYQSHSTIPSLSLADAQTAIVGNICRCTGYRPILDACKSFSDVVDVEDLGINSFWDSPKDADLARLPPFSKAPLDHFPEFLIEELNHRRDGQSHGHDQQLSSSTLSVTYGDAGRSQAEKVWVEVNSLDSAFEVFKRYDQQDKSNIINSRKFVVGNTSSGYYKDENPQIFIDISCVPELLKIEDASNSLLIGAAVSIEKLIFALEARNVSYQGSITGGLISHLRKVANPHVRHRASVGGNLILAQQRLFASDLATLFLAIEATLKIFNADGKHFSIAIQDFLHDRSVKPGMLLESISLPLEHPQGSDVFTENDNHVPNDAISKSTVKQLFKSYRAAPRRLGNALASINAAFLATISAPYEDSPCFSILDVKLAFGAFGKAQAMRAYLVEKFLVGKTVNESNLLQATEMLKSQLASPLKSTMKSNYKASTAVGFLFDFFRPFLSHQQSVPNGIAFTGCDHEENKLNDGIAFKVWENLNDTCDGDFHVSGKQTVPTYENDELLGKPVQKSEAKIQAAGEAMYVDDIPSPQHCLFAAFVLSSKASARIKHLDPTPALESPGVVAFISAKDIPKGGVNVGPVPFVGTEIETLFAADVVMYVGHPLGVVVADSPQHAKDGAGKVTVEYEDDSSPILCIEDAVAKNSFFNIPPPLLSISKVSIGDVKKGFVEADEKVIDAEVRTGCQYHFYMETQTALAIPDEDDCIVVYSSSQSPDYAQKSLSVCLGIPIHNVRVITRRAGGGFGGKAFRNITIASACAVAAYKLRHPVRMYLDRKSDMIMTGGRHPTKTLYSVGFKSDGKITSLKAQIWIDSGWSEDFSPLMPNAIAEGLKKYDWGSMDIDFKLCKTNLSSKTAMRAPGRVQGSFIADTVIEHVAAVLSLDVHKVLTRNMHTLQSLKIFYPTFYVDSQEGYTLPSMWDTMLKRMASKERNISSFNSANKWCKRGLSVLPCIYGVHIFPKPARVSIFQDGSVVVEVGGIEIGQGLWTKVKQAVVYGLSQLLPVDGKVSESVKIRVVQADSISLPHGSLTAGSTASEGSCEAARQACQILVDRIMPLKVKKEQASSGSVSWNDLIKLAMVSKVDLSAQVNWFPNLPRHAYLNYGVATTEIDLDVLTGAVKIIETDIVYDCGRSMNPAVDIGQVEGSFVQGIGFFLTEEHVVDNKGLLLTDSTWTYKPPTLDNIPQKFSVELVNGPAHENRVLSSKACSEPPLLLAGTVHSAIRHAIEAARQDHYIGQKLSNERYFHLDTPASMEKVRNLCGLGIVEDYLKNQLSRA